jgi:hypothetical protein
LNSFSQPASPPKYKQTVRGEFGLRSGPFSAEGQPS